MTKFTLNDTIQVIDKEIEWCKQNQDETLSLDYMTGFVNGLIQARSLLEKLIRGERKQVLNDKPQNWREMINCSDPLALFEYLTDKEAEELFAYEDERMRQMNDPTITHLTVKAPSWHLWWNVLRKRRLDSCHK